MSLAAQLKIGSGHVNLGAIDADGTPGVSGREEATAKFSILADSIRDRQMRLFVNGRHALLVILQGMDTSGKDGTIRHVFEHVNPAGCNVTNFKEPTILERRHDFLWRAHAAVPPFGIIGIFNRSYYEDVLVVRVHADRLLPDALRAQSDIWEWRYQLINTFEAMLVRNNVTVVKFFLHIDKDEQKARLLARQQDPEKQWKLCRSDLRERAYWDDYQRAYEKCLDNTNTKHAPWYIIPANRKWYRDYAIATILDGILDRLELPAPEIEDKALLNEVIV